MLIKTIFFPTINKRPIKSGSTNDKLNLNPRRNGNRKDLVKALPGMRSKHNGLDVESSVIGSEVTGLEKAQKKDLKA